MQKASYRAGNRRLMPPACRVLVVLWLWILALPLQAQQPVPTPPAPAAPASPSEALKDYVIGSQDLLQISILEAPELSREVRVNADGSINLPLMHRISLAGLTLDQAEKLIARQYKEGGILNDPHVSVAVKELQSKPVTVIGAVRNPGVFQVSGQSRLLRMISQAGGLTEEAGTEIQVLRTTGPEDERTVRIPTEAVRAGEAGTNIPVWGGDTINVRPAGAVYAVGAVNRPGRQTLGGTSEGLTVLRLVALSEDLKRTAKASKAVLIRKDESGALQQIPVDIKKILAQQQPDVALRANDVLFVPDSAGKRALTRGLEAAIQIATSVAIWGVI
jgi:polysaccharide export outer membrane protein